MARGGLDLVSLDTRHCGQRQAQDHAAALGTGARRIEDDGRGVPVRLWDWEQCPCPFKEPARLGEIGRASCRERVCLYV